MLNSQYKIDSAFADLAAAFSCIGSKIRPSVLLVLTAGLALGNAKAQTLWTSEFSNDKGWDHPEYGTTIMYGDLNGDGQMDVCGRGVAGIYCSLSNGSGFNPAVFASPDFADASGWNDPIYYTSLRLGDVNGDGHADVCGRGYWGISCALGRGDGTFEAAQLWTTDYGNPGGWGFLQYGSTIMLGDLNGDGRDDICARGGAGIYCSLSTGNSFSRSVLAGTDFADSGDWYNPIYYSSLRLADVNGDGFADVCGRGYYGISCALGKGDGTFKPSRLWTSDFRNALGWDQLQYGSTMMFADINGDGMDDVCGRGIAGVYCAVSTGSSFRPATFATAGFSDATGWNHLTYYGSIRLADVNGDQQADLCGRGEAGIFCAVAAITFH